MGKTNFKKWGWWAIGGVVAVVIIAVVVAAIGSGPEPASDEGPEGETPADVTDGNGDGATADEEDKGSTGVATTEDNAEALPQSGPIEDGMLVLLLAGVFAYIISLGLNNVMRAAKA